MNVVLRSRALAAVLTLTAGTGTAGAFLTSPANADAGANFSGLASATGIRTTVVMTQAPVTDTPFDGGAPVAHAALDSVGTSQAFASNPYPGPAVVSGPGLVSGFAPGNPDVPQYPFFVSSDYPLRPEAKEARGPSTLTATSSPQSAEGTAATGVTQDGNSVGRLSATAKVSVSDAGAIVATSTGLVDAIQFGPFRLGRVLSSATTTLEPDGRLARTSSFEVTGASIGDQAVGIGPEGFVAAGTSIPLPQDTGALAELAKAGIHVRMLREEQTEHGVLSAALQVVQEQDFGSAGKGSVRYTMGLAAAQVAGTPAVTAPEPSLLADSAAGGGSGQGPASEPATAATAVGGLSGPATATADLRGNVADGRVALPTPQVDTFVSRSAEGLPGATTSGTPVTDSAAPAATPPVLQPHPAVAAKPLFGVRGAYLTLALGSALALIALTLIRLLSVRFSWTS